MELDAHANIALHLQTMAGRQPSQTAIITPSGPARGRRREQRYSYGQLHSYSNGLADFLLSKGVTPGMRAVLMAQPGFAFFATTFALFKAGIVPVFIDPGMGIKNLKQCLQEAQPQVFIGNTKAHSARKLLGWARHSLQYCFSLGSFPGCVPLPGLTTARDDFPLTSPEPQATAAVLFTSGSTGVPKGAVYTHGIFQAQIRLLQQVYGIAPAEIDMPTFPLFGLFAPALGMTSVIPQMDFTRPAAVNAWELKRCIDDYQVSNMFGSPALLRRLVTQLPADSRLPSLKRVVSAGAPVPAAVLAQMAPMLADKARIYTPYGATEALPVASIDHQEILADTCRDTDAGAGVCVGRALPETRLGIIAISDDVLPQGAPLTWLPQGEVGEIVVSGQQVTSAYYERPQATRLSKVVDEHGRLWHRMGDVGYLDKQQRLWFCGRKSQRLDTGQRQLYTIPLEGRCNTYTGVARSALVGIGPAGAQQPVICVEPQNRLSRRQQQKWAQTLLQRWQQDLELPELKAVLVKQRFPVDIRHNAKIFREKLAVWAQRQLA